jgi:hypothetical protein
MKYFHPTGELDIASVEMVQATRPMQLQRHSQEERPRRFGQRRIGGKNRSLIVGCATAQVRRSGSETTRLFSGMTK